MKREIFNRLLLLMLLMPLIYSTGCGVAKSAYQLGADTAKSLTEKIVPGEKPLLKKRVMVSSVMNQAGIKEEKVARLTEMLVTLLEKDDHLLVTLWEGPAPSREKVRSPQFGVVIDPELVKKADEKGMNVLVTCILNPFEVTTKKSGIWPFRRVKREVEVSIAVNALDITTGTLFLTNLETKMIKIQPGLTEQLVETRNVDVVDVREIDKDEEIPDKELFSIMEKQSSKVIDALDRQHWSGKIHVSQKDVIRINGGKDIGITEGDIFEVFGIGESISSPGGKKYSFLGPKVGEIRADEIFDDYSLATPLGNERFENGQVIKLKR